MTYDEIKKELQNLPVTWYPALIKIICESAQQKDVFQPSGMTRWVSRLEAEKPVDINRTDEQRVEWLCQCTAGQWEELQNIRLANPRGFLRGAIDLLMDREKKDAS